MRDSITCKIEGLGRHEATRLLEAAERAGVLYQCTREHYEDASIDFSYLSFYHRFPIGDTGIEHTVVWCASCCDDRLRLVTPDEWVAYMEDLAKEARDA